VFELGDGEVEGRSELTKQLDSRAETGFSSLVLFAVGGKSSVEASRLCCEEGRELPLSERVDLPKDLFGLQVVPKRECSFKCLRDGELDVLMTVAKNLQPGERLFGTLERF